MVQKAIWPSAGSLVVQLTSAAKGVMLVTVTLDIYGATKSVDGTGVGEILVVGVGVGEAVVLNVLNVL